MAEEAKTKFQELLDASQQAMRETQNYLNEVMNFIVAFRKALVAFLGCNDMSLLWCPVSRESEPPPKKFYGPGASLTFDESTKKWKFALLMTLGTRRLMNDFSLMTENNVYRIALEPGGPEARIASANDQEGFHNFCSALHRAVIESFKTSLSRALATEADRKRIGFTVEDHERKS